ncbi:MAG: transporter ATP-binding protein [Bacteroidetes bacterium]|nr:transporter ATP-binding protein [Bacteroidota bacterium]
MITIKDLVFYYKRERPVLNDISIKIENGVYGLLGENGAGKSSLLHLISGLLFPKSGTCKINGYESSLRHPEMMAQLFFLPDESRIPMTSIRDFAKRHSAFYSNFNLEIFEENLDDFKINGYKRMTELSLGQKKKAIISYVLALNTPVILMDEPTNGLDITSKDILKKMIARTISDDQCLIISTHQVYDFENLLDAVIILGQHKVLLNSTMEEITNKLVFTQTEAEPQNALYSKQTVQGYSSVLINDYSKESTVNIDLLYKTVLKNDGIIEDLFNL